MSETAPPIPHGWQLQVFVERDTLVCESCEGSNAMKGISDAIARTFPGCEIVENHEKFPSIFANSEEPFPRKGSFEVSFTLQQPSSLGNGKSTRAYPTTLHSKLASGAYPSEVIIVSMLSQYITTMSAHLHPASRSSTTAPATRPDGIRALQMKALPPRPPLYRPSDGAQTERAPSARASQLRPPLSARASSSSSGKLAPGGDMPSASSLLTPSDLRDVLSQSEHAALLSIPAHTTHAIEANKKLPASRPTSRSTSRSSSTMSSADTIPSSRLTPTPPSRPPSADGRKRQLERPRTAGLSRPSTGGTAAAGAGGGRPSSAGMTRRDREEGGKEASVDFGGERRVFEPPSVCVGAERQYHSDGECVGSGRNGTRKLRSRPQSGGAGERKHARQQPPQRDSDTVQTRVDGEDGARQEAGAVEGGFQWGESGDGCRREGTEGRGVEVDDMARLLSQGRKARAELTNLIKGGEVGGEPGSVECREAADTARLGRGAGDRNPPLPCRWSPLMASEVRGTRGISIPGDTPPQQDCDVHHPVAAPRPPAAGTATGNQDAAAAAASIGPPLHGGAGAGGCSSETIYAGIRRIVADLASRGGASASAAANGCRVVASLSTHPSNRKAACALGAPGGVVAGMRAHRGIVEVQEAGCAAVASLCCGVVVSARAEFVSLGAAELVLMSLQTHSSCSGVVTQACRSLLGLCGALSDTGAISCSSQASRGAISLALRTLFEEECVQGRPGCGILETLEVISKGGGAGPGVGHTPQARGICSELLSLVRSE